ncbi:MAG TPA: TIR domain-containing protein [Pyrinomonadaceae bacterium]|nr:TIR domain-containing protein [Pyrinomonadaceae bacterium]
MSEPSNNLPPPTLEGQSQSEASSPVRSSRLWVYLTIGVKKLLSYLDAPFKFLFGRDIFISYSRADASKYAPKLANDLRAEVTDLSLYLDRWVAPPSGELPRSLRRHLRWSSLLVVVTTENALKSDFVMEEIRRFADMGRQIIPVSVPGEWEKLSRDQALWKKIKGATAEREEKQNILDGTPSAEVIDRIKNSTQFTRQDQRLRSAVRATVLGILLLIAIAIVVSNVIIQGAQAEAADSIRRAQIEAAEKIRNAEVKEKESAARATAADQRAAAAAGRESAANDKAAAAAYKAAAAAEKTAQAERKTREALSLEQQARARTAEQLKRNENLVYASNMTLAQQYHENDRALFGQQFLDSYLPASPRRQDAPERPRQDDLRGFEWRYLWRVYHKYYEPENMDEVIASAAAFSPDGKLLAVVNDGSVTLWDTSVYDLGRAASLKTSDHPKAVAVAFSRDSKWLAVGAEDGTVSLLKVAVSLSEQVEGRTRYKLEFKGGEPEKFKPHNSRVTSLSFSHDGRRLAITSEDAPLVLWDVTAMSLSTPDALNVKATAAAFSPVGGVLAYAHLGRVYLWDADAGGAPVQLEWDGIAVAELSFSPDGRRLAAASLSLSARVWDVGSRAVVKAADPLGGHASITFSPDGRFVATARFKTEYEGEAKLWDAATYKEIETYEIALSATAPSHMLKGRRPLALAFSPDGKTLVVLEDEGSYKLLSTAPQPAVLDTPSEVYRAVYSPDGKVILTANGDGTVHVLDALTRTEKRVLQAIDPNTQGWAGSRKQQPFPPVLALSPDGRTLAASSGDKTFVTLWETDSYTMLATLKAGNFDTESHFDPNDGVSALAFSPDGEQLAVGFYETTKLYDTAKLRGSGAHQPRTTLVPETSTYAVRGIAFLNDKRTLVVMGNRDATLWDLRKGKQSWLDLETGQNDELKGMTLSPDGKKLAVSHPSWVKIFNAEKLQAGSKWFSDGGSAPDHTIKTDGADVIAFSLDGRTLVASDNQGLVKFWSTVSGQELIRLRGHEKAIVALAFSPDGLTLATGGLDKKLKLWFAASDEEVRSQPTSH